MTQTNYLLPDHCGVCGFALCHQNCIHDNCEHTCIIVCDHNRMLQTIDLWDDEDLVSALRKETCLKCNRFFRFVYQQLAVLPLVYTTSYFKKHGSYEGFTAFLKADLMT